MRLVPGAVVGVGLELNVDYVSAVVVDLAGRVEHTEAVPVPDVEEALPRLLELAATVAERLARQRVAGVAVALPALVRGDDRSLAWAPNLPDQVGDLARLVEPMVGGGVRVRLGNDANFAAYAEARHGAARGVEHALYLTGTVGIGAGIIQGGRVLRGADGFAGEVGHLPLGVPTARCGCGRTGCWEASIGLHAMLAEVGMPESGTPVGSAAERGRPRRARPARRRRARAGRWRARSRAWPSWPGARPRGGGAGRLLRPRWGSTWPTGPGRAGRAMASPAQRRPEIG